jgi:poly(3-hydroxybutyrate) depolymerase
MPGLLAWFVMVLVVVSSPALAAAEAPVGSSTFEMQERFGLKAKPMAVHLYRPARWKPDNGVLIVMHGRGRNGAEYRDEWTAQADAKNLLVAVPEFDSQNFPGTAAYNWGSVVDDKRKPQPQEAWIFDVIDAVHAVVRVRTGASRETYSLYGHSAGAQFAHRFLLLAKAPKAEMIISANAGSYTMPKRGVPFPFGLDGVSVSDDDLRRAFARPVVILLGDQDIDPDHPSLPRQSGAMAQGPHRLARGKLFYDTAKAEAGRLGAPFNWRIVLVAGIAHFNKGMADQAVELVADGLK